MKLRYYLRHGFEYILIFVIVVGATILLAFFKDFNTRTAIITFLSFTYIAIGVWHHHEEKNLKSRQILEHVAIGAIIFIILATVYT